MIATNLQDTLNFIKTLPCASLNRLGVLIGSRALDANIEFEVSPCDYFRPMTSETDYDIIIEPWQLINFLESKSHDITAVSIHYCCESDQFKIYKVKCQTSDSKYEFELVNGSPSNDYIMSKCNDNVNRDWRLTTNIREPALTLIVPTVDILYGIKMSHLYFNIHWQKTIEDIHCLRKYFDQDLLTNSVSTQITQLRRLEVEARLGQSATNHHINLEMTNKDFFKQSDKQVKRIFEHDFVHQTVAFNEEPMFLQFKTDPTRAKLDWNLFEKAPLEDRLNLIREECMVLALERYLLPFSFNRHQEQTPRMMMVWQKAYILALERICTNLWKGPFRDFAIDHYPALKWQPRDLCDLYDEFDQDLISKNWSDSDSLPHWVTRSITSYNYFCSRDKAKTEAPEQFEEFLSSHFNEEDGESSNSDVSSESEEELGESSNYNDEDEEDEEDEEQDKEDEEDEEQDEEQDENEDGGKNGDEKDKVDKDNKNGITLTYQGN